MICPWRAPVPPSGRGNLDGTRMPTKRGSDRMFSRGIFTTDLPGAGSRSGQDPPHQGTPWKSVVSLDAVGDAWASGHLGTQAILKSLCEFECGCASIA